MIKEHNTRYEECDVSDLFVGYERMVGDYQPIHKNMITILKWLSGKKNIIAGVITTTSAFLALKGVISPEDATYINAISLLVFGSASVATQKFISNK